MIRHNHVPSTKIAGRPALSLSGNHSRMVTAYSRCARTCTSGVVTGSTPATMRSHLSGIHEDRKKAREKRRAEDPGGTTSRSHDVRRVPASRRNSNTLIMAFGSSAVRRAEGEACLKEVLGGRCRVVTFALRLDVVLGSQKAVLSGDNIVAMALCLNVRDWVEPNRHVLRSLVRYADYSLMWVVCRIADNSQVMQAAYSGDLFVQNL